KNRPQRDGLIDRGTTQFGKTSAIRLIDPTHFLPANGGFRPDLLPISARRLKADLHAGRSYPLSTNRGLSVTRFRTTRPFLACSSWIVTGTTPVYIYYIPYFSGSCPESQWINLAPRAQANGHVLLPRRRNPP